MSDAVRESFLSCWLGKGKSSGVDLSTADEAEQYLENEPSSVQKNITFRNADFLTHDFGDQQYDTVVLTEILEHITQPENFIAAAAKLLPKNGRVVVTVPFGINDFIDHKHTYYLLEPYQLIAKYFIIQEVKIIGKWIGLIESGQPPTETLFRPSLTVSLSRNWSPRSFR
jgi:2-polyprenyl-3-methyl-5-hydroxy-6-metoxy-1,4-benzoquinol methylase